MFEKFTERGRKVIIYAKEEAEKRQNDYLGTEHLLLAVLKEDDGLPIAILKRMGITSEEVRLEVERNLPQGANLMTFGDIPFTPRAKKVLELAVDYINYVRFSLIPFGLMNMLARFFASIRIARHLMIVSILSNILNFAFNYILIFGRLGFPAMGIKGAALGTVLSQVCGLIYIIIIYFRAQHINRYKYCRFKDIRKNTIRDILKIAAPPGIQNFLVFLFMLLYESMVEKISVTALAATTVAFSSFRINKTLVGGFSHAAAIHTGNAIGAGDGHRARQAVAAGQFIALIVGIIVFVLAFFFPGTLALIFSKNREAVAEIARAFRFFAVFYFFEITAFTIELVFVNNGYGRYVLFSEFSTNLVFMIGFTWLTGLFVSNVYLAWLGFGLYQLFHALILHIGYRKGCWLKTLLKESHATNPTTRQG